MTVIRKTYINKRDPSGNTLEKLQKPSIKKRDPSGNTLQKLQKLILRKDILVVIHYRNYKNLYQGKRSWW